MPESTPKKHRFRRFLVVVVILLAGTIACLWPALKTMAPLVQARRFTAVCRTPDGSLLPVTVYRAMGLPDRVYLHLPAATESLYRWIAVDFRHAYVGIPNGPRTVWGMTYVRTDQPAGIDLLSPKLEDTWQVSFTPGDVVFRNRSLDVSLHAANVDAE